jgi:hypothetical protein
MTQWACHSPDPNLHPNPGLRLTCADDCLSASMVTNASARTAARRTVPRASTTPMCGAPQSRLTSPTICPTCHVGNAEAH